MSKNLVHSTYKSRSTRPDALFSILIPSWDNLPYLQACINSIRHYSTFQHQIVVVANQGSDEMLTWLENEDIDHIHSKENLGICIGLNLARDLVSCDYLLYINDDMIVAPEWDLHLKDAIDQIGHRKFMLSSTMVEPRDTGNPCVILADHGDDLSSFDRSAFLKEANSYTKEDWNGSTWPPNILPTELWDRVGGMSEEFSPGMYSDPDLSMKCWQAGVRHFQGVGKSRVYHFGSKSTRRLGKNTGRKIFLNKWGMTANQFYRYYLQMGSPFQGPLKNKDLPLMEKVLAWFKQFF